MIMGFTAERLVLARQLRGFTKVEIADELKVSVAAVTYWEQGKRVPEEDRLRRLAHILGVPYDYFGAAPIQLPASMDVSFRSLRSLTQRDRDRARAAASIASAMSVWLENKYELPPPRVPDLSDAPPSVAAAEMRRHLQLGSGPLPSILALLESMGVRCFSLGIEIEKADALSAWVNDVPVVLFNTFKSAERGRNDAAHELGHLALHRHHPASGEAAETQAITFAAEFLVPMEMVLRNVPRPLTFEALIKLKREWGVSATFMLKRIVDSGLLTDWSARALWRQLSIAGYRSTEPDGKPRESSQVLEQVVAHLFQSKKSLAAIARDLSLATADVEARVFGLLPEQSRDSSAISQKGLSLVR